MPCILKSRISPKHAHTSFCGKMIHSNIDFFKNVEDAYKGSKPICPACRKVLGLEKKVVKKDISSIQTFTEKMTIFFNNKTKIILDVHYNEDTGYFVKDYKELEEEYFEKVSRELKILTRQQTHIAKKRVNFDQADLEIIEKVLEDANNYNQLKMSLGQIEKLEEIQRKFKIYTLHEKTPY